jgi:tetratricopeptide (TPR) repeat protein
MLFAKRTWLIPFALLAITLSCKQETAQDYLSRGNALYSQGKYQEAALAYRKALQKDVRLGEGHYRYGLALIAQDHSEKAVVALRRALTLMPDHEDAQVQLGNLLLSEWLQKPRRPRDGYEEIRTLAQRLISRNPKSFGGLRQMGYLALHEGDRAKAAQYFLRALAVRPLYPDVTVAVARLQYDTEPGKSEALLRDLLRAQPAYRPAYDVLYEYSLKQRRTADAEQVLLARRRALPKDPAAILQLAGLYYSSGRTEEAEKLLNGMLANAADFPDRFLQAGDFHASRRDYERALAVYRKGADALPGDRKKYQTRIANLLLAQNNRDEALQILEASIGRDPEDGDSRAARAALWLDSGKPELLDRAIQELASVLKAYPENASVHYTLARAHLAKGNRSAARTHAHAASRYDPAFVPSRFMVAEIDLADRRPKDALAYAVEALEIDPSNPKGRLLLVRALQLSGRIAEAKSELGLLLKDSPDYRDARIQMGYVHIDERKYVQAETMFRSLLRPGQDDTDAMAGLVQVLFLRKQPARALEELKSEVARSSRATGMKLLLADVAMRAGESDLALRQYTDLIGLGIRTVEIYASAAQIHYRSGRLEEAIAAMRQAYALAPRRTDLAVTLGGILEQAGRPAEARVLYRKVLESDPQNATAMNNLAYNLGEAGQNLDEALELAGRALRLRTDPNFSDTLGWIYLKKNMTDSALQIFRNLVEKQPANPTFRLHLGMVLLAKGDRTEAQRELQQALQSNPSPRQTTEIRSLLSQTGI